MARLARIVVPGMPHHIIQRGNRRQQMFFCDEDYTAYLELMAEWCGEHGVAIWAYCLMPNHVHLIAVPQTEDGLVQVKPLLAMVGDWKAFLRSAIREEELRDLREHGRTGRPVSTSLSTNGSKFSLCCGNGRLVVALAVL